MRRKLRQAAGTIGGMPNVSGKDVARRILTTIGNYDHQHQSVRCGSTAHGRGGKAACQSQRVREH